jgi:serine/threonine protein kinase
MRLYEKIINDRVIFDQSLSTDAIDLMNRMLEKNPDERIVLDEIREHAWVTKSGAEPMMSTAENCALVQVTEEEVENSFKPALLFLNKVHSQQSL